MNAINYSTTANTACKLFEDHSHLNTSLIQNETGSFKADEFLAYSSNEESAIIKFDNINHRWIALFETDGKSFKKTTRTLLKRLNDTQINKVRSYLEPVFTLENDTTCDLQSVRDDPANTLKQPPLLSAEDHFNTQPTNVEPYSIEM